MAGPEDPLKWGDDESTGTTLVPVFMQNFKDLASFSDECKSKAGDTPVTVSAVLVKI